MKRSTDPFIILRTVRMFITLRMHCLSVCWLQKSKPRKIGFLSRFLSSVQRYWFAAFAHQIQANAANYHVQSQSLDHPVYSEPGSHDRKSIKACFSRFQIISGVACNPINVTSQTFICEVSRFKQFFMDWIGQNPLMSIDHFLLII